QHRPVGVLRPARRAPCRASRGDGAGLVFHLRPGGLRPRSDRGRRRADARVLRPGHPDLPLLLRDLREARQRGGGARARVFLRPRLHHRGGADPGLRRRPAHGACWLHRLEPGARRIPGPISHAGRLRRGPRFDFFLDHLFIEDLHRPRDQGGGAGRAGAAPDGGEPGRHQAVGVRHRHRRERARRRDADHRRPGGAGHGPGLYRTHVLRRGARGARQHDRHARRRPDPRHRRVDRADDARRVLGACGRLRPSPRGARHPAARAVRQMKYSLGAAALLVIAFVTAVSGVNEYFFYAAFVVLQFMVLATAWNILGGYAGYVNFGTAAFFAIGSYTAVVLFKWLGAPLAVQIVAAAAVGGLLGFGVGLLTLRLRGIFFAIATVAIIFIMETMMMNWRYVGGATGLQLLRPDVLQPFASYTRMLFFVMALLAVIAVSVARYVQVSWIGRGLRAIRDSE